MNRSNRHHLVICTTPQHNHWAGIISNFGAYRSGVQQNKETQTVFPLGLNMNRVAPVSASHYIKVKIAMTLTTVKLRLASETNNRTSIVPNFAYELVFISACNVKSTTPWIAEIMSWSSISSSVYLKFFATSRVIELTLINAGFVPSHLFYM